MGRLLRDALAHFREVIWVVVLLCLVLIAVALIFGGHVGYGTMALISLGFALLTTLVFVTLFAINLIAAVLIQILRHFSHRKG